MLQKSLSTNVIKEIYKEIYLKLANRFQYYKEKDNIIIKANYRDDTNIKYKSHYDIIIKDLNKNKCDFKLKKELKLLDPNIFTAKEINKPDNKKNITGKIITNDI